MSEQAKPHCPICEEIYAMLDADESSGYPGGKHPMELTLQERVKALLLYASDWRRWCEETEQKIQPND